MNPEFGVRGSIGTSTSALLRRSDGHNAQSLDHIPVEHKRYWLAGVAAAVSFAATNALALIAA